MLVQVLKVFEITPDYDLNIMQYGQDLNDVTARFLIEMRNVLKESTLYLRITHGDTSTSTVTTLVSFFSNFRCS